MPIIGYVNNTPLEARATAHDPHSGRFTSGGANHGMAKAALKAAGGYQKKADAAKDPVRKNAYQKSADAYGASQKAHTSGSAADHAAAHTPHGTAEAEHSAIHRGRDHNGAIKGHHGAEASGHSLAKESHA